MMKLPPPFSTIFSFSVVLLALSMVGTGTSVAAATGGDAAYDQCNGIAPQESLVQYLGMTLDYELAERICCNNQHYAEPKGYLEWEPDVAFFRHLEEQPNFDANTTETIFYDSVCGLPLFIAPRGRSYEDFKKESIKHGWPSFRPEEMITENVILHQDGRMESKCLTHLGHNLPEGGEDRYCIDLVCIAGAPLTAFSTNELTEQFPSLLATTTSKDDKDSTMSVNDEALNDGTVEEEGVTAILTSEQFDPDAYESSAEKNSGKVSHKLRNTIIAVAVVVVVLGGLYGIYTIQRRNNKHNTKQMATKDEEDNTAVVTDGGSGNDEEENVINNNDIKNDPLARASLQYNF